MSINQQRNAAALVTLTATIIALIIAVPLIFQGTSVNPISTYSALSDEDLVYRTCQARLADTSRPLTSARRQWLQNCVGALSPTASPSASPSTISPSPSISPTPSASSTPTPSPSESPTASPTPSVSPSPSPTTPPVTGCMPQPSLCGYPDSTNTGVPAGTALTVINGDWHITASGVYSGKDVTGCVYVEASNVTIRNSRIRGNCWFAIRTTGINGNHPGLVVEDTEIVLASTLEGAYGICCSEYTLTRVWLHGAASGNAGADCVYFANNVVVQDSFCEVGILPGNPPGNPNATSAHSDGMTSDGGDGVRLIHNTIRNPNQQTSGILLSTNSASVTNTEIRDGIYAGGGYTVYCGTDSGGVDAGTTFNRNRIARDWNGISPGYYPNGGFFGATTHCNGLGTGNVWDDTGDILPGTSLALPLTGTRHFG